MQEAQRTLAQADYAVRAARRAHEGKVGHLSVGFLGLISFLPGVIRAFRRDYADVELTLRELTSGEQLTALREARIDIGFMRPFSPDSTLVTETLARESLVAALPRDHPLAQQHTLALEALKNDGFVIFPRHLGPGFYDYLVELCRKAGFHPKVVQEAAQMPTLANLVAAGMGVALVPAPQSSQQRDDVVYVALAGNPVVDLIMVWREADRSHVLRAFSDLVKVEAQKVQGLSDSTLLTKS